jgi:UDP-glucose 4-epimerase
MVPSHRAAFRGSALFPREELSCLFGSPRDEQVAFKNAGETAWRSQAYRRRVKVLVTGAAGFICGYLVAELLRAGHEVVGVDNYSKYGPVKRSFDGDPRYRLVEGDAKDAELLTDLAVDCDHVVAGAAMIGGISYFHEFAYDLLAENERICAATFDAALTAFRLGRVRKITVLSSSMVFESSEIFPTPEGAQLTSPPPRSTYGFQKLATEYYARGAHEQYGLPFTIVRPFNCVGIGERRALRDHDVMSGNVKLAMSHVVPDLVQKVIKGQDPLHILGDGSQVRHYTYGGDLAHGIRLAMESEAALNEDFNLSTAQSTTVRELAEVIWRKVHGPERPLHLVSDPPYEHDVQMRVPDVRKAHMVLGFEAKTSLDEMLDEVILWIREEIKAARI